MAAEELMLQICIIVSHTPDGQIDRQSDRLAKRQRLQIDITVSLIGRQSRREKRTEKEKDG